MRQTRLKTRRSSRVGAALSSAPMTFLRGGTAATPVFQANAGTLGVLVRDAATTGSGAESLTVPLAGLIATQAGSVTIETYVNGINATATPGVARRLWSMNGPGTTDRLELLRTASGIFQVITGNSAGNQISTWTNTPTEGLHRYVVTWDASEVILTVDGADRITRTGPTNMPAALQALLYVNSDYLGAGQWGSPTCRMSFGTRKLSPAERVAVSLGTTLSDATAYLDFTAGQLKVNLGHPWKAADLIRFLLDRSA